MTLYVLAGIFAVLGIVCILLPFHVAMTGLCFLALGAVCLALRLLRGKKHERTWRVILLTFTGVCMLTVFGAVAELEREYILQRQREGIAIAKANGVYKGRKPIQRAAFDAVVSQWLRGEMTAVEAQRRLELSPRTFYRKVRDYKKTENRKEG